MVAISFIRFLCLVCVSAAAVVLASASRVSLDSHVIIDGDGSSVGDECGNRTCHQLFAGAVSRQHPSVTRLTEVTTACSAKFVSLSARPLAMYWDDGQDGVAEGVLGPGATTTTNSYETHVFYFTENNNKANVIARVVVEPGKTVYPVFDDARPGDAAVVARMQAEEMFSAEYRRRTGLGWRHYFGPNGPRPPPVLPMWPAPDVGVVHRVIARESFWQCDGPRQDCKTADPVQLDIECVSVAPRAFIVDNFLSDFEADSLIASAKGRVARSGVGDASTGRESSTRTSYNAWLPRHMTEVTESISRRVAEVLRLDEIQMGNAELMQVVYYNVGQRYEPHHDWGVDGRPESRFITILMYLTDQPDPGAGGETSFPKSSNGPGFKVSPVKGSAVIFYNLLEDGNGDDLALHAALPVQRGEKWLANYWIWDPVRA